MYRGREPTTMRCCMQRVWSHLRVRVPPKLVPSSASQYCVSLITPNRNIGSSVCAIVVNARLPPAEFLPQRRGERPCLLRISRPAAHEWVENERSDTHMASGPIRIGPVRQVFSPPVVWTNGWQANGCVACWRRTRSEKSATRVDGCLWRHRPAGCDRETCRDAAATMHPAPALRLLPRHGVRPQEQYGGPQATPGAIGRSHR